jgi:hypothetical protein
MEFLSEYDFDINHINGKENKVVDALSGRVHEMHVAAISMYRKNLKDESLEPIKTYPDYAQFKERLQQNNVQHKYKYYRMEDGILLFKVKFMFLTLMN